MVGPNPLTYIREPSGENFTAPYCPAGLRIETLTSRSRSQPGLPAPARQRATRPGDSVPSARRVLRTRIRRPSTRRLPPPCPGPRRSSRPSGPRRRDRAFLFCWKSQRNSQGSDISLNTTAPVTGSTADVTIDLANGEYSPSCDLFSRSNKRTSSSLSITDARVPSSASDMLAAPTPSSWMRVMLVSAGCAREDAYEVDACRGAVPELDGLHGEQQSAIEVRLLERERGDAACLRDRGALPCEVRLEPREEARRDSDDRESGCAGRSPRTGGAAVAERPRVLRSRALRRRRGTLARPA